MKTSFNFARSIRYAAFVTMISGVSMVQACSSDTIPTAPLGTLSVPSQPATDAMVLRVSGTVSDDNGAPVSGVVVRVYRWAETLQLVSTAVTDDKGFYSASFLSAEGISAFTSKEGYVSAWHSHQIVRAANFQWDLRISRGQTTAGN